jgi:hypothetical protein
MRKGQLNSTSKNLDTSKEMGIFIHAFGCRGRCLWEPWVKALGLVGENYILSWWWGMGSTLFSNNTIPPPNVVLREEGRENTPSLYVSQLFGSLSTWKKKNCLRGRIQRIEMITNENIHVMNETNIWWSEDFLKNSTD